MHQLLVSISHGEPELQRYFGSFTNNIPIGFIQQVYATAKTVTANGNAQISTAQSKFGGASGSFDGTNSYLSTPDSPDWAFGTVDFTIDFWVRFNALPSSSVEIIYSQFVDVNNRIYFGLEGYGTYYWRLYCISASNVMVDIERATTIAVNTWYHIAVVRSGTNFYIFQAGTQVGSTLTGSSNSLSDLAAAVTIGEQSSAYYLNGWLDEYRVSKGIARWTSNFTPPTTEYASDGYTILLLHMNGANGSTTFIDDSQNTGPDFSISASPTSQSVGAGIQASSLLTFASQSSYTGTVNIAVTSGCSATGMSCSFSGSITSVNVPNGGTAQATLLVQTLLTTPGGTYPIVVTGTDSVNSALTQTVTFMVTVNGPNEFNFNVKAGATQIVVTVTWTGSGTTTVAIAPPGGSTIYDTSGVTYDRTSIALVSGQQPSYTNIHRATFTLSPAPTSPQMWTLYVSGPSTYTVTVEVT